MRIAIAGAGNVGRSIARELITNGHHVLLIDQDPLSIRPESVPGAAWLNADACEMDSLEEADLEGYDVSIAATGDDKANLVHSLLAKTEFGVPRTVGRVNRPTNEWMFDEVWGVDVAVSTPRIMSALVEEAVSTGELVRLLTFTRSTANLSEIRLPDDSDFAGTQLQDVVLPQGAVLVAVVRDGKPLVPNPALTLEGEDEMLFVLDEDAEDKLAVLFEPASQAGRTS